MISLKQIQYALSVEQTLHFKKAAELCSVSQSALSTALAEMEKQLGLQQHPEEAQPNFGSLDWSQRSVPDESLLNLVTSYYKPHAGHLHRNQLQQEQEPQSMMYPPSPPASTQSHQNSHINHQQQLSETILQNVQQAKTLLHNRQQQNYGECGVRSSEEMELSGDPAYGNSCENFDRPIPLKPEQQFPSYKRRCTS